MIEIIKASAGSGKTYTLAVKYIEFLMKAEERYLTHGDNWVKNVHRRTLAITFTNNSTNEMKQRIVESLHKMTNDGLQDYVDRISRSFEGKVSDERIKDAAKLLLEDMLEDWQMVRVSTIDSFFNQVVNAFIRELGIDQTPAVDLDTDNIVEQAVDNLLNHLEEATPEGKSLVRFLGEMMNESLSGGKKWNIRPELIKIAKHTLTDSFRSAASQGLPSTESVSAMRRCLLKQMQTALQQADVIWEEMRIRIEGIEGVYTHCKNAVTKHNIESSTIPKAIADPSYWFNKKNTATPEDGPWLTDRAKEIMELLKGSKAKTISALIDGVNYTGVIACIDREVENVCRENDSILISSTNHLINEIVKYSTTPFIYEKTGLATDHYMIDEFQDTSAKQWDNFIPLIAESNSTGKDSLVVGDVKQSIYRWRNGDWRILHEGITSAFPNDCKGDPLDTNYRSLKGIVDFNNSLYGSITENFTELFGKEMPLIYSSAEQICDKEKKGGGSVTCLFADNKSKEEFEEVAMQQIVRWLKSLKADNALAGSAILVRKNEEAQFVAHILASSGISFVSAESLLVGNDICVRYITAAMRYIASDHDPLAEKSLMSLSRCITDSPVIDIAMMDKLRWLPLDEMVMALVRRFHMESSDTGAHRQFVYTFADMIRSWLRNNDGNINRWLDYWESKSNSACIPLPADDNAVKIMTIHKSKGLQFTNVALLMNATAWECGISARHKKMISAAVPQDICTDTVSDAFVNLNGKFMEGSDYDDIRKKEWEECCIDELNTLYVATTRAKERMFIVGNCEEKDLPGRYTNFCMVNVLRKALEGWGDDLITSPEEQSQDDTLSAPLLREHGEHIAELGPLPEMMNIRVPKSEEQEAGIAMHEWLASIEYEDGVGTLDGEKLAFWNKVLPTGWFSREWERVWNEAEIAYGGRTLRPDRVMFRGQQAVVVDWKFGQKNDNYEKQVRNYCYALKALGYNVSGWLFYSSDNAPQQVF